MLEKTSVRVAAGMFGRIKETRLILPLAALCCFTLAAFPPQSSSPLELESVQLPAAGRQATYLTVNGFGRYSLRVRSESGTGLQLVDRMAGPGQVAGRSGEEDCRLDACLERGRYKLLTWGHKEAQGTVRLRAEAFRELHTAPLQLVELKPVQSHASGSGASFLLDRYSQAPADRAGSRGAQPGGFAPLEGWLLAAGGRSRPRIPWNAP